LSASWRGYDYPGNLFLVTSFEVDPSVDRTPWHQPHLDWLIAGHDAGTILLSGPSHDRALGIYVVQADSLETARAYAQSDPYHAQGIRDFTIVGWEIVRRAQAPGLTGSPLT
jgi:uncharacterized protein YciI